MKPELSSIGKQLAIIGVAQTAVEEMLATQFAVPELRQDESEYHGQRLLVQISWRWPKRTKCQWTGLTALLVVLCSTGLTRHDRRLHRLFCCGERNSRRNHLAGSSRRAS